MAISAQIPIFILVSVHLKFQDLKLCVAGSNRDVVNMIRWEKFCVETKMNEFSSIELLHDCCRTMYRGV